MNWLQKIADVAEYLNNLGATPEISNWIQSQPDANFYVNQFRQNPSIGINELAVIQPQQRRKRQTRNEGPTMQELHRTNEYQPFFQKWALKQLRKMRVRPHPGRWAGPGTNGTMDYDYSLPWVAFDNYLGQIHDWYTHTINNPDGIFSYSWGQARAASDEWHAVAAGKGSGKIYEPTNPELVVFQPPEWKGWSIQKMTSENDMLVEGNLMNHCVGEFCENVKGGSIEVYSLRDPQNKPHVTIGIDLKYNNIIQLQGNSNVEPDEEYKVYLRQWLPILQKERPGLTIDSEEPFDFQDIQYVDDDKIDEEINRIVYEPNEYGLENDLSELDVQDVYDTVILALTSNAYRGNHNIRNVHHIGPAIAEIAWDADKERAKAHGLLDHPYNENSENYLKFKTISLHKGVDWLWDTIQSQNEEFYDNFHTWYEPSISRDDFATEAEYEKAEEEGRYEYKREARSQNLPSALDDAIAEALVSLKKTKPFLPKPPPSHTFSMKNWLQKISAEFLKEQLGGRA